MLNSKFESGFHPALKFTLCAELIIYFNNFICITISKEEMQTRWQQGGTESTYGADPLT